MKTKPTLQRLALAALLLAAAFCEFPNARAQGTAFTYQGRLNDGASAANGVYDLQFSLFPLSSGGSAIAGPVTKLAVGVTNGLFTTIVDFGGPLGGGSNWLELAVRTNGAGSFSPALVPRQQLTPVPYAVTAANFTGVVSAAQLPVAGVTLSGAFSGNGASLTNVNASALGGLALSNFWRTGGNTGANPTNGAFLGTTDGLPLELRVNNQRGLRLEQVNGFIDNSVNVLLGSVNNSLAPGVFASAIAGGGSALSPNKVTSDFSVVGGGGGNTASGLVSAVGGGANNQATNSYSTVAGGFDNLAGGQYSASPGGGFNSAVGDYSFAAGFHAKALHKGSFVWGDSTAADFSSTTNNQFLIRAGGGVAINTNNPNGAALAVNGSVSATALVTSGSIVAFGSVNSGGGFFGPVADSSLSANVALRSGGNAFSGQQTVSSGNVGIGTTTPGARLHVVGSGFFGNDSGVLPSSVGAGVRIFRDSVYGVGSIFAYNYAAGSPTNLTLQAPGGNVGIGTTSPTAKLDINGTGHFSDSVGIGTTTPAATLDINGTGHFSGNVGIGTTTPDNALTVQTGAGFGIEHTDGNVRLATYIDSGGGWLGTISDHPLNFFVNNGNNAMTIGTDGNVSILGEITSTAINLVSDRNAKEKFKPVDARAVLDKVARLPITEWQYKKQGDARHIGPMAQDFHEAFELGHDDKHITSVDEDGVALAAIQGLNQKVEEKDARIQELEKSVAELKEMVAKLARQQNGGAQ